MSEVGQPMDDPLVRVTWEIAPWDGRVGTMVVRSSEVAALHSRVRNENRRSGGDDDDYRFDVKANA